jgi:hypothetical protein
VASTFEGADGWLFLGDDSNSSVRQFTGEVRLSEQAAADWASYFDWMDSQSRERQFQYSFMIAPSKESVYHKFYPFERGLNRPVDDFLELFPNAIYPADLLRIDAPFHTYPKTDTHWNDFGAMTAVKHQILSMGIDVEGFRLDFALVDVIGDLGNKVTPNVSSPSLMIKGARYGDHCVLNNQIHNHGRIWIFENEGAPVKERCLIFGDSFGLSMTKALSRLFSRLVYVHTTTPAIEILEEEKPSIVLCEVAERFLTSGPASPNQFSFTDTIRVKIDQAPISDRQRIVDAQPKYLVLV